MNEDNPLSRLENLFIALADTTRLRLLNLMREDEVCVYSFVQVLGESQPKISRHLAYLRNAGIVEARREGKWMYYKIVEPDDQETAQILHKTLDWLGVKEETQNEYKALIAIQSSQTLQNYDNFVSQFKTFAETNMKSEKFEKREVLETFML